jgi:beta-lactamase regulating signal transducer with metallopeptidase domain
MASMAASTLFSAIWEGAILAVCALICLRLLPGLSAAARSVVWMNVFVLMVLLQVLPFLGARKIGGKIGHTAPFQFDPVWSLIIAGTWAVLSLFRAGQLIFSAVRLRGLARRAVLAPTSDPVRALLQVRTVAGKATRTAELCTSTEVERPSLFGFFRPRILLPPALMERLTPVELQQVVLHEMEHLHRGDDWTNLLQKLALVLFPLNPALLWVERRLCAERELACDDRVLRSSGGRKAYAICLTRLAEYSMLRRSLSLALGAWERQSELVRRVHRILSKPSDSMSPRRTLTMTGSLIAVVLVCAVALGRSPQLVGFSLPSQTMAQTDVLPQPDLREAGPAQFGASAKLVKAVMPEHSVRLASLRPTSAAKPHRRTAVLKEATRQSPAARPQAWIVMTEWSETVTDNSPRLVFTVERAVRTPATQPAYAAVPIPYGWLIVEI